MLVQVLDRCHNFLNFVTVFSVVKLSQGISINGFQSLPQDRSSYFSRELSVTDNEHF